MNPRKQYFYRNLMYENRKIKPIFKKMHKNSKFESQGYLEECALQHHATTHTIKLGV